MVRWSTGGYPPWRLWAMMYLTTQLSVLPHPMQIHQYLQVRIKPLLCTYVRSSAASQFESCTVAELTHVTTVESEISTCLIIVVILFERIHRSMLASIELYTLQ